MLHYIEYLRAKRALFVVAIILAVIFLIAVALRLFATHGMSPQAWTAQLETSPTAHVVKRQLPDGTVRTTIDDPANQTHAVVVQKGAYLRVDVDEPSKRADAKSPDVVSVGSISIDEHRHGATTHTTMVYRQDGKIPLDILWLATLPFGLLCATMLGGALAKENDGHLELAWTKPASRERIALMAVGIDAAAVVASQLLAFACYMCCVLIFGVSQFTAPATLGWSIVITFAGSLAWYCGLTAWSASMKSHLGLLVGLAWPAALIVPGIAHATANAENPLWQTVHAICQGLSYIDPLAYMSFTDKGGVQTSGALPIASAAVALILLVIGYTAASLVQWRRVEA